MDLASEELPISKSTTPGIDDDNHKDDKNGTHPGTSGITIDTEVS